MTSTQIFNNLLESYEKMRAEYIATIYDGEELEFQTKLLTDDYMAYLKEWRNREDAFTKDEIDYFLGGVACSYKDGFEPKDFPMEFGTDDYFKALDTVVEDIQERFDRYAKRHH